ncbi:hypothetical protein BD626DRAFT_537120 [Schizophyllum amplum]|uniref:Uncharacterized protein n=1 Tax=Schizophyllum amplum TaxID=97359 RepID=A0A550CEG0_9AGAR|nr:hypothetical protein BD626DRAFT_537120 [Auriculariopsis ampla]
MASPFIPPREKAQAGGATANGHSATSNGGENPTADDQGKNQSNHATRSGNKDDEDKDHSARRARTLEEYRPLFRALGVPPECMEQFADVGSLPQSGEEKLYVMQLMLLRFFSSWSE